jgi:diguanylate cyclase (GGDEF)-like protein
MRHRDGHWLHVETAGTNLLGEPTVRGIVLNSRDVSERKALEAQLTHQAFHDPLTGLANRVLFLDRVGHALTLGRRQQQSLAVLFLDLDDFKVVNDSLGHAAGDRLLSAIAGRLLTCVRDSDTVARIGGDEFAILVEDATDDHGATMVAERIAAALQRPILVQSQEVFMSASIGIATATEETAAADLLRNADMAMYVAKSQGKGRFERFEPRMYAAARERLELQADLRQALERGDQFTIHYQPIVWLRTGEVTGVEALVRWMHPTRGLLLPLQFIPVAEETGLIAPLGAWVVREACRQVQEWQRGRPAGSPLTLTVNISGYQLQSDGVVDDIRGALAESGLDPSHLVLEITESVLMQHSDTMLERLRALKAIGVRLAIDDFGTGYSSLGYLQRFPIDILKIDKAFVDDVQSSGTESALVRAIIALGDTLRIQTIAEGIELQRQLAGLQAMGCELGQGFFLARPVTGAQIDALLAAAGGGPAVIPLSAPVT